MIYHDSVTNIRLSDSKKDPFADMPMSMETLTTALRPYILSASGWRNVYAVDKNTESLTPEISLADSFLTGIMALSFAQFMAEKRECKISELTLLIASDTRPTGPAIADIFIRILLALGVTIRYIFISAAPEAFAYSGLSFELDGFIYISASHNPVGYNGIKYGIGGKVLGAIEASRLIDTFKGLCADPHSIELIPSLSQKMPIDKYEAVLGSIDQYKAEAIDLYRMFTGSVSAGSLGICNQDQIYNTIRQFADTTGAGVVIDFNGSARTRSIDRDLLTSMGVSVETINDQPGLFAHRIVPEGKSLIPCKELLESTYASDPSYLFGYLPDCDGDRGNIVYIDETTGKAKILEAQEVFALVVLSELSFITLADPDANHAVVVNGPTSMRVDQIAKAFGAEVFRAEVGEAHAVSLAESKRESGFVVRILGEGSNGGNITHPAAVRDPLNTALSLLKLMAFRGDSNQEGLFKHWCEVSGQLDSYHEHFTLSDIIETLPLFTTTSAYEERAILRIRSTDQETLKNAYERLFSEYWETHRQEFSSWGISSYQEINTTGMQEIVGSGKTARPDSSTGGLKIQFSDENSQPVAYIWMRGSKTEPVFRVLADVKGSDLKKEEWLLNLHKELIARADR